MNEEEIIRLIRQRHILEHLADGPVSVLLRKKGKLIPATVTRAGDWVYVTTGRFFRRRMKLPLAQLKK